MTSQREAAWQAHLDSLDELFTRTGLTQTRPNYWTFLAGWDARDADVSALLEAARAVDVVVHEEVLDLPLDQAIKRWRKRMDETHEALRAALAAFPAPLEGNSNLVAGEVPDFGNTITEPAEAYYALVETLPGKVITREQLKALTAFVKAKVSAAGGAHDG